MDLVSVVIPCYRQAHFLGEAIESALGQSHPRVEIVVVDDGSPDEPIQVVQRYPSVRYVRQANSGVAEARNRGIQVSRGAYLVFLDSDDRLLPAHLEVTLKGFHDHPEAGLVCGDYRWFDREGGAYAHVHDCRPSPDHYATLLRRNFIGPPHAVMFRRDVIEKIGGFRRDLVPAEDQELYLRVARSFPVYCHHRVIAEYRRHDAQASQKFDVMLRSSMRMLRSQRGHVRGNRAYADAYREGIRFRRALYVGPLEAQIVADVRARRWRRAGQALATYLLYHPQGLLIAVLRQVRARLRGRGGAADGTGAR